MESPSLNRSHTMRTAMAWTLTVLLNACAHTYIHLHYPYVYYVSSVSFRRGEPWDFPLPKCQENYNDTNNKLEDIMEILKSHRDYQLSANSQHAGGGGGGAPHAPPSSPQTTSAMAPPLQNCFRCL